MKSIVNKRFNFELNKEVNWSLIKIKKDRFHIIYKKKSFIVDVLAHNRKNKSFEFIINNNFYSVQLKDRFDELLHDLGLDKL